MKYLMRGDSNGQISVWKVPETTECDSMQIKTENGPITLLKPCIATSLKEIWADLNPRPAGVLDQLLKNPDTDPATTNGHMGITKEHGSVKITSKTKIQAFDDRECLRYLDLESDNSNEVSRNFPNNCLGRRKFREYQGDNWEKSEAIESGISSNFIRNKKKTMKFASKT